jgi:hypothetical protein
MAQKAIREAHGRSLSAISAVRTILIPSPGRKGRTPMTNALFIVHRFLNSFLFVPVPEAVFQSRGKTASGSLDVGCEWGFPGCCR